MPVGEPEHPDALVAAALTARQSGDLPLAKHYLVLATSSSENSQHFNMLGNVLADLGDVSGADRAYENAIALAPNQPDAWTNRGNLLIGTDDPTALSSLETACRLAPHSVLAWMGLGKVLRSLRRFDDAIMAFERAREIDPERATIPIQIGLTHAAAGRADQAIAVYDAAEHCGQSRPELLDNRAAARIDLGDIAGAKMEYDRLVNLFPAYAAGHRARARLLWEFDLEGDPFASYQHLAEQHSQSVEVWHGWLTALASFRQFDRLVDISARAKAILGDDPSVSFFAAVGLSETGRVGPATDVFAKLYGRFGQDSSFLLAYIRHALRIRDPSLADSLCERAVQLEPNNQLAWAYRSLAWRLADDPREDWLIDYERMVTFEPAIPPGETITPEAFALEIADHLRGLHEARVHPAEQSLRGGTQTAGSLFQRIEPWAGRIKAAAQAAVTRYIDRLPDDSSHPYLARKAAQFRFSGSWSVRLEKAGYHIAHVHPDGWISSAFYFVVPDCDPGAADGGLLALGGAPEELGLDIKPRRIVRPTPGWLCLFPSMVWHETTPVQVDAERLTTAFDVVPVV